MFMFIWQRYKHFFTKAIPHVKKKTKGHKREVSLVPFPVRYAIVFSPMLILISKSWQVSS